MPETPAIALMRDRFTSAYAAYHGHEAKYTCPTPLKNAAIASPHFNLWSSTQIGALDLTAIGIVIVEVFYESYTGERGFIKLEHIFNNKGISMKSFYNT